jgi:hypothetical protein
LPVGANLAFALTWLLADTTRFLFPGSNAPRVYREYPLRGSGFVPINFILDGKFDPDEERNRVKMIDKDKELLERALLSSIVGVKYAIRTLWVARWRGTNQSWNRALEWVFEGLPSGTDKIRNVPSSVYLPGTVWSDLALCRRDPKMPG